MPELAEVEFSRRQWTPGHNHEITRLSLHPKTRIFRDTFPAKLRKALLHQTLESSRAHGKRVFFTFAPPPPIRPSHSAPIPAAPTSAGTLGVSGTLIEIHLGMTGRLECRPPDHQPAKHDHFVLYQNHRALVFNDYRQFGRVLLHENGTDAPWKDLPPQPHDATFTATRLRHILTRHPKLPIKALLLDQDAFPGIGNWMADEVLWRAQLSPATPSAQVDPRSTQLLKHLRFVCRGALKYVAEEATQRPSTKLAHHTEPPTWGSPPKSWLFQHRWAKDYPCPRCGTLLARETLRGRTACFCPACQR